MLPGRDVNKHNEKISIIVSDKNGRVIDYYKNCKTKLKLICSENHEFEISPHKLYSGRWCSKCSTSISEEFTRFIFEKIYNSSFDKFRFWCEEHYIELDGYNKDLNIAFEYNGIQHYRKNEFVRTDEQLNHQQYLDSLKVKYCEQNNIKLIIIPYNINHYDIFNYIKDKLVINSSIVIDYNIFSNNYSFIRNKKEKLMDYVIKKDGKILEYGSYFTKIECNRGHIWNLKNYLLKKGRWCLACYKLDGCESHPRNIENIHIKLKDRLLKLNFEILDIDQTFNLRIKCENGHINNISYKSLSNKILSIENNKKSGRKICKDCLLSRQNKYLYSVTSKNIQPIQKYKNRNIEIVWRFTCGHESIDKLRNISERIKRCNNTKCKECTIKNIKL